MASNDRQTLAFKSRRRSVVVVKNNARSPLHLLLLFSHLTVGSFAIDARHGFVNLHFNCLFFLLLVYVYVYVRTSSIRINNWTWTHTTNSAREEEEEEEEEGKEERDNE